MDEKAEESSGYVVNSLTADEFVASSSFSGLSRLDDTVVTQIVQQNTEYEVK